MPWKLNPHTGEFDYYQEQEEQGTLPTVQIECGNNFLDECEIDCGAI
jgi:hypothetical protein